MNKKTAVMIFLIVCLVLAALLVFKAISSVLGGSIFAVALVVLGILSRGFTNKK
ncbi:MAG TPA: hypothetical protein VMZ49_07955 [Patescibacteria group bacterium]|nr:hypothetical protein [Patescibacteria group bacterium]